MPSLTTPTPPPLPCASPTWSSTEADRLTRLIQLDDPRACGRISATLTATNSNSFVHATLARRGKTQTPTLVLASDQRIAAVGEHAEGNFDPPTWNLIAARTIASLVAAHQASGTYLGWMSRRTGSIARLVLLDLETVALEADMAFLTSTPRILPAETLLSMTPNPPTDTRQLVKFLTAARLLLSFPSIPRLPQAVANCLLFPSGRRPVRHTRAPRTPPRYSPPRMAIADLSTPPRSTSPQKRSSPGGGSPGKRLAIDVLAWRSGKSGAALFDFGLDDAGDERCCSPTEIDTPPPSEGEMAHAKAKTLTFGGIKASHTIRPAKSGLQAEETLRPGGLALRETETVVPGTLGLQPAWEATLGPTSSMRPLKKCSTNSNGNDTGFKCLSRSRQQPGDTSHRSLEPRSQSLATASTAIDSTTMASIQRLDNCKRELGFEDYLAVLVEMKVRVVLVSSAEMDRAVEGIRAAHS